MGLMCILPKLMIMGSILLRKAKMGVFYEVQVKSVRKNNYTFILQNKIKLDDTHLICYIRFVDGKAPECFVIPATVFKKPDGTLFTCRDYIKS